MDALTTTGKQRDVPTGQVIEGLIVNRLAQRPAPISQLGAWAQTQAIEAVYGLPAAALNDDRIGRALAEGYPPLTEAWPARGRKGRTASGCWRARGPVSGPPPPTAAGPAPAGASSGRGGGRSPGWISRRRTGRPRRGGTGRWSAPKTGRIRCGRRPTACAACSS